MNEFSAALARSHLSILNTLALPLVTLYHKSITVTLQLSFPVKL